MSTLRVGFVGGSSLVDKVIEGASGSQYANISHSFIYILDSIVESEGLLQYKDKYMGVWIHPINKYEQDKYKGQLHFVDVEVKDIEAAKQEARDLIGTPYGYLDCIASGMKFLLGFNFIRTGKLTAHCSETVSRILRAGGIDICPYLKADEITPILLYEDLIKNHNGKETLA